MGLIKNIDNVRKSSFVEPSGIIALPCINKINEKPMNQGVSLCHSPFDKNFEMNCTPYTQKYGIIDDDSMLDKLQLFEYLYTPKDHPYKMRLRADKAKTSVLDFLKIYNNNQGFGKDDRKLYAYINSIFYNLPIMQQFEEEFKILHNPNIKPDEKKLDLLLFQKSFFDVYFKELDIVIDPAKDYLNLLDPNCDFYKSTSYQCASFPFFQGDRLQHAKGLLKDSRIHPLQFRKMGQVLKALNMERKDFNEKDYTDLVFYMSRSYEFSPIIFNSRPDLLDPRYISPFEFEAHHSSYRNMTHKTLILLYILKADEQGSPYRELYWRLREAFLTNDRIRGVGESISYNVVSSSNAGRSRFLEWTTWARDEIQKRIQRLDSGTDYVNKYTKSCVFDLLANPNILNK